MKRCYDPPQEYSVTSPQLDIQQDWAEYYRLRRSARLSVLALPIALYLLVEGPIAAWLTRTLGALSPRFQSAIIFSIICLATVLVAMPVLKWVEWRCPRCREKFAQPAVDFGLFTLIPVCWRLVFDSHCARCNLQCGSPMIGANS
jgi:hypothetical protein